MQDIELRQRHRRDESRQEFNTQEVPRGVDHDPSVSQQWLVGNVALPDALLSDHLGQSFQGINEPRKSGIIDKNFLRIDV